MLDEKDSNHHRCTATHDQGVKDPEMYIANRTPDPPPQHSNDRCISNHVYTFSTGVKEAGFVIGANFFWRYPVSGRKHLYGAFDGMTNEFKEA